MDQERNTNAAAHVVRVHRPELTEAERERRLENIRRAAAQLIVAVGRPEE